MAVYLVIENGETVNRIEWDGETLYDPGEGHVLVPETAAGEPAPQE